MIFENEEFTEIPDFPGYFASRSGKILQVWPSGFKELLVPSMAGEYLRLTLRRGISDCRLHVNIIITRTFHGPPPTPFHEVNHKNGNKVDNDADNLEWATHSENMQHAHDIGLIKKPTGGGWRNHYPGVANTNADLTDAQVLEIRKRTREVRSYALYRQLAQEFKTSFGNIRRIVYRETWKHI